MSRALCLTGAAAEKVLFDFESAFNVSSVACRDASVAIIERDGEPALRLSMGHRQEWPGITLKASGGRWNLSAFEYLAVDVTNAGTDACDVHMRIDSPADDGEQVSVTGNVLLAPGSTKTLSVALRRRLPKELAPKIFGVRGYPGGFAKEDAIDPANIDQLLIFAHHPSHDHTLVIDNIRAGGSSRTPRWLTMSEDDFFPMIDRFGQFVHKDWIGKVESIDDFQRFKQQEAIDLDRHPRPDSWNPYGGWKAGPQLQATGRFRVEKHLGKWWLVDPDGRLFWSHGIDCVRSTTGSTPITGREFLFADLPARESSLAPFYGRANWAPHGFYQGKNFTTYNFTGANLLLKYGPDWRAQFADLCHRRLQSWGMNTIGNWSDSSIYLMQKTPYVATLDAGKKPIEGSSGYWGKFPDVFDSEFRESLAKRLAAEKGKSSDDPWCLGYFVDNELAWGDEISLAVATLASPPDQVAKQVF